MRTSVNGGLRSGVVAPVFAAYAGDWLQISVRAAAVGACVRAWLEGSVLPSLSGHWPIVEANPRTS
jgi:hypothetical protein